MLNSLLKILQWKHSLRIKPKGHTMVYTALHDLAPCYLFFSWLCPDQTRNISAFRPLHWLSRSETVFLKTFAEPTVSLPSSL